MEFPPSKNNGQESKVEAPITDGKRKWFNPLNDIHKWFWIPVIVAVALAVSALATTAWPNTTKFLFFLAVTVLFVTVGKFLYDILSIRWTKIAAITVIILAFLFSGFVFLTKGQGFTMTSETPATTTVSSSPVAYIFLSAEIVDRRLSRKQYDFKGLESDFGRNNDEPKLITEAFGRDPRYPVASEPEVLRVTIRNAGALPITRIWLNFPLQFQLVSSLPASPSVKEQLPSPLNPITIMPSDPRGKGLIIRDTPVMLSPNDQPYVFQFRNVSGAYAVFDPLPTQAEVVTTAGEQTAQVQSVTSGLPILILSPNRP